MNLHIISVVNLFILAAVCSGSGIFDSNELDPVDKVKILKNLARALERREDERNLKDVINNPDNDKDNNVENVPQHEAVYLEDFNIPSVVKGCPDQDPCNPPNGFCTDKMGDPYGLGYLCVCFGGNGGHHCQHVDACSQFPCPRQRPDCYATVEDDCTGRHCYPPKINAQIDRKK